MGVLLLLLVDVLAEVHDAAHRRRGVRCDLDEIESVLEREIDGFRRFQNPELLTFGRNNPHSRSLDAVVAADGRERVDIATLIRTGAAASGDGLTLSTSDDLFLGASVLAELGKLYAGGYATRYVTSGSVESSWNAMGMIGVRMPF